MSLKTNINHLATAQGVIAVRITSASGPAEFRGDESWVPALESSVTLLERTHEKTIRAIAGRSTIVVQTEGDETAAVVFPTGHAIAKSLRRMIRRAQRSRGKTRSVVTPTVQPAAA